VLKFVDFWRGQKKVCSDFRRWYNTFWGGLETSNFNRILIRSEF
jgi:hypothetical protein